MQPKNTTIATAATRSPAFTARLLAVAAPVLAFVLLLVWSAAPMLHTHRGATSEHGAYVINGCPSCEIAATNAVDGPAAFVLTPQPVSAHVAASIEITELPKLIAPHTLHGRAPPQI